MSSKDVQMYAALPQIAKMCHIYSNTKVAYMVEAKLCCFSICGLVRTKAKTSNTEIHYDVRNICNSYFLFLIGNRGRQR